MCDDRTQGKIWAAQQNPLGNNHIIAARILYECRETGPKYAEDVAEGACTWGLIWAAGGGCPSHDNKKVEENAKGCYSYGDKWNGRVDFPEVTGEGTTKE